MVRLSAAPPASVEAQSPLRVLVADDDPALRRILTRILEARGFLVETAEDGLKAVDRARSEEFDVALIDLHMPGQDGLTALPRLKEVRPDLQVILMTAFADVEVAVKAIREGAFYFFNKPFSSNEVVTAIVQKAGEHRRLALEARRLLQKLGATERFGELAGTSTGMRAIYKMIEGVAPVESTVLILGESGTGKELVARAIHQNSPRAARPLVVVNCGAIPKELVEAELFGHARGAFTGAQAARQGLFVSADGGTLFLDEVGDLPPSAQVKLLRTLQSGEVRPVGSDATRTVDVRVLAATNADLSAKIETGEFRRDLFYRLNVIAMVLPPLRDRGDDILVLAKHFLGKLARRTDRPEKRLSEASEAALLAYAWPGNVRELEHAMERAFILCPRDVIEPTDLPFEARPKTAAVHPGPDGPGPDGLSLPPALLALPYAAAKKRAMALFDEAYLGEQLRRAGGNRALAARHAGVDRANLRRVLRRTRGT
ncbi:MAG TPA: sigma-54 dependent transcriptional regulator [Polyangiaceae bacterium]